MTGRDLITASLRLIGALAPGESLDSQEAVDGLAALNRMLGSWSTESLLDFATTAEEFTLVAGQASYTIGAAGNFNTTRPQSIGRATIKVSTTTPAIEYPLNILTAEEWADVAIKNVQSTIPMCLFSEGTFPLDTIHLYPVPSAAHTLVIYPWMPLEQVATIDTALSFPPGYDRSLIYNLAMDLAPEYGRPIPDAVAMTAQESKANIKRMNYKPRFLKVDSALMSDGGPYNIIRGK